MGLTRNFRQVDWILILGSVPSVGVVRIGLKNLQLTHDGFSSFEKINLLGFVI